MFEGCCLFVFKLKCTCVLRVFNFLRMLCTIVSHWSLRHALDIKICIKMMDICSSFKQCVYVSIEYYQNLLFCPAFIICEIVYVVCNM